MREGVDEIARKLSEFDRIPLSLSPTPCHRLLYLSTKYNTEIYCKREDLTGFGFGGNKTRKLEWLLAAAIKQGCDTLVTSGWVQSNFCRIAAAAAAYKGLSAHLVLAGKKPTDLTGNLYLNHLLGAKSHFIGIPTPDPDVAESALLGPEQVEQKSREICDQLEAEGKKVFFIPLGGAMPMGSIAYSEVMTEIIADQKRLGIKFDYVLHASGSGGTQAGLMAGKAISGWPGEILGISVGMPRAPLVEKVSGLALETVRLLGGEMSPDTAHIDDTHIGPGYATPTDAGRAAITLFAQKEGVFLDNVYTGKAAGALLQWLDQGRFNDKNVLFLHTGGTPELFAH